MTKKRQPPPLIALGCLGLTAVVVAVVVIVIVAMPVPPAPAADSGPTSSFPTVPVCKAPVPAQTVIEERVRFADPTRVDPAEAWPVVEAIAARMAPDGGLFGISASDLTSAVAGKYDLTKGFLVMNFEYRCNEAGAPPGQDLRQGMIHVVVKAGNIHASRDGIHGMAELLPPLHTPPCPASAAFAAAVAAGVPANAVARMSYGHGSGELSRQARWLVMVDGHPEHRREVDGKTCSRVAKDGELLPVVVPPPGPPPPPATVIP